MRQFVMSRDDNAGSRGIELRATRATEDLQHVENRQVDEGAVGLVVDFCALWIRDKVCFRLSLDIDPYVRQSSSDSDSSAIVNAKRPKSYSGRRSCLWHNKWSIKHF